VAKIGLGVGQTFQTMPSELIIGVSGGIAAYKTAALVSSIVQLGHGVSVVMTPSAHQFIGPATFEALTGRRVPRDTFDMLHHPLGPHISLAEKAELLCIAPATANTLAKLALGLADDLLSTLALSFGGPIVAAPAMNCEMWAKPSVQRNIDVLTGDGVHVIPPSEGWLSCRKTGPGRMADPEVILHAIEELLNR
jgi:phosphopantothenoylcysteine decarboxylase/phosphopantothenate--cysteine ligase